MFMSKRRAFETFEHMVLSLNMNERMDSQDKDDERPELIIYGYDKCLVCRTAFINSEVGVRLDNRNSVTKPSFFLCFV